MDFSLIDRRPQAAGAGGVEVITRVVYQCNESNTTNAAAATSSPQPSLALHNKNDTTTIDKVFDVLSLPTPGQQQEQQAPPLTTSAPPSSSQQLIVPPRFELVPGQVARDLTHNAYWLVWSDKLRVAMTFVPKVMCTSIRSAIHLAECNCMKCRCWEGRIYVGRVNRTFDMSSNNNWTRAIVLRDPFERVVSAYQNADSNPHISVSACRGALQCSFAEWIEILAGKKKKPGGALIVTGDNGEYHFSHNEHHTPQARIAQFQKMHYHYVLRLSSKADPAFFWKELVKMPPIHENESSNNNTTTTFDGGNSTTTRDSLLTTPKEKAKAKFDLMTDDMIRTIATLYMEDLLLWQQVLERGTPRVMPDEYTMYDYFLEELQPRLEIPMKLSSRPRLTPNFYPPPRKPPPPPPPPAQNGTK